MLHRYVLSFAAPPPDELDEATPKTILTLRGAKAVVAAAEAKAKTDKARVVIAVVDDGGNLILLQRLDGTQVASVNVAMDKARTAAIYRRRRQRGNTQN